MYGWPSLGVAGSFLPALDRRVRNILGPDGWSLTVSHPDASAVEYEYPDALSAMLPYIAPHVVLDLGTHAEPIPRESRSIHPYVAAQFHDKDVRIGDLFLWIWKELMGVPNFWGAELLMNDATCKV